MARKALAWLLLFSLLVASPGTGSWLLFADSLNVKEDPLTGRLVDSGASAAELELMQKLKDPRLGQKLPAEQVAQALGFIERYPGVANDPKTAESLRQIAKDLDDPSKDPGSELQSVFDKLQKGAREKNAGNSDVVVLDKTERTQLLEVRDSKTGQILFFQRSEEIAPRVSRRTILREDPVTGRKIVDAIVEVDDRDAAHVQHVVYNRKVQEFLRTLKKFYSDQCSLVRKINNGAKDPPLTMTGCVHEEGTYDDKITPKAIAEMHQLYEKQQTNFKSSMVYTNAQGRPNQSVMDYLDELDARTKDGTLDQMDWRDLQAVQRAAMKFYSANELETLQKYVLIQLTSFFSQITNSQAKGDKQGVQDASLKDNKDLQKSLTEIEKGNLNDYDWVMKSAMKAAHLSAEDQKFVPQSLFNATGEAIAYLGYAVKAKTHAFAADVSGEEQDAAIEEAQHWVKLAQIQLQTFEASSLAIQMERLKAGELSQHLGLTDDASKAEAQRLAALARDVYLKKLGEESVETKSLLLRQTVSNFFQTLQNAQHAHLNQENLQERLRTLAAKALEIRYLYLAKEFERFKSRADFQVQATVLDKMENAAAYTLFLKKLEQAGSPSEAEAQKDDFKKVALIARAVQDFSDELKSQADQKGEIAQQSLDGALEVFRNLVKFMAWDLPDGIPTPKAIDEDSKTLAVKWGHFGQAYQAFSNNVRMFDMVNELDLYVRKYMSSEWMSSESQTAVGAVASMKWLDAAYNFLEGGAIGHPQRDKIGYLALEHSPFASNREAYQRLIANKDIRRQILELMNKGDFGAAMKLIADLDPEGAKRAADEAKHDKADKDPFESLDFESAIAMQPDNDLAAADQGALMGCFKTLQSGILGYMAATGVLDMGLNTVLTAGLGQFYRVAETFSETLAGWAKGLEAMKAVGTMGELSRFQRLTNMMLGIVKGVLEYGSRVIKAYSISLKQLAAAKDLSGAFANGTRAEKFGILAKQFVFHSLKQSAVRSLKNAAIMSGASIGMTAGKHFVEGDNSQYAGYGDAVKQGAIGGLSFAGKAGLFFTFSPLQSTAMGTNGLGRILTEAAESPGPLNGVTSFVARMNPRWAQGTLAQQGLWGKIALSAEGSSPTYQMLARTAVYGGGMLDGMLKFTLLAEVPQAVVEASSMGSPNWVKWTAVGATALGVAAAPWVGAGPAVLAGSAAGLTFLTSAVHSGFGMLRGEGSSGVDPADGMTSYMRQLSRTQTLGMDVAQTSWLLLPMQSMQGTSEEMHDQLDQMSGINRLMHDGRAGELTMADGAKVTFERPWPYRLLNREFFSFGNKSKRTSEVATNSQTRKAANKFILEDAPLDDVIAAAVIDPGEMGGLRQNSQLKDMVASGLTSLSGQATDSAEPALSADARRVGAGLKDLPMGKGRLYAYFDSSGHLEEVSAKPNPNRSSRPVAFDVGADGYVELAKGPDGKPTWENFGAIQDLTPRVFERAQEVFRKALAEAKAAPASAFEAPTPSPTAPADGQSFVSNERYEAGTEELQKRMDSSPEMRRKLRNAGDDVFDLLLKDGQARASLKDSAQQKSLELRDAESGLTFRLEGGALKDLREALDKAGGDPAKMLKDNPSLRAKVSDSRETLVSFVLDDPKTGKGIKVSGKYLRRLREMAEMSEIDNSRMPIKDAFRSAFFGDEGGYNVLKGSVWKIMTGRKLNSRSQIISKQVKAAAAYDLKQTAQQTPQQRLAAIGKSLDEFAQAAGPEAAALRPLQDAVAAGAPERVREQIVSLSGGVEPSQLLELKYALMKDGPELEKVAAARVTVDSWGDAPAAKRLMTILETPCKSDSEARPIIDKVVDMLSNKVWTKRGEHALSPGATLETLDSLYRRASGQITEDDLTEAVQAAMGRRIEASQGDLKAAMGDMRSTLESDAYVQLANDNAVQAVMGYRKNNPEAARRLEAAKRLLIGTWERGVFGQRYARRVTKMVDKLDARTGQPIKDGQGRAVKEPVLVWEVPAQNQFRDMYDHSIPSFRSHQREAIEADLELFASGKPRVFDLMKTSGGKTLLGFVLGSFLERYAQASGREGFWYATTDAGLVKQTRDNYLAMFKGRKPSFDIITYEDLFQREATAALRGAVSPAASYNVYADELDQVGLGTPLSLGAFSGTLRHVKIDPVQIVLREDVAKVGLGKDDKGNDFAGTGLVAQYKVFGHQRMEGEREMDAFLRGESPEAKAHPKEWKQFMKDWSDISSSLQKAFREKRAEVEDKSFVDKIPEDYVRQYAKKIGFKGNLDAKALQDLREQIRSEMLSDYDKSFGSRVRVGVFEAKYGSNQKWLEKILKSAYMSGTWGDKLNSTFQVDEERQTLGSIVNDQYLESLDRYERTAQEAWKGLPITNDFETGVVVKLKDLLEMWRRNGTAVVGASGTQPAELESFLEKLGVVTTGEGSPVDKAEKVAHVFADKDGQIPYARDAGLKFLAREKTDGRLNPETGEPAKNLVVYWLTDNAMLNRMLGELEKAGISSDRIAVRMTPGSDYWLQNRYRLDIRTRKNDAGLQAGTVDVAFMVGQGGFRGHEMPLDAYNGGEIKMFVLDSYTLTDVGSIQLMGRIDRGRVPKATTTDFEMIDDFHALTTDRYYRDDMPRKIDDAIGGKKEAQTLSQLKELLKAEGLPFNEKTFQLIMSKPNHADERKTYRDYMALTRLREAARKSLGDGRLAELAKLDEADPRRRAAVSQLMNDRNVASLLVIEMRRGNEKRALAASGVGDQEELASGSSSGPSLLGRFMRKISGLFPGGGTARPGPGVAPPAPASP